MTDRSFLRSLGWDVVGRNDIFFDTRINNLFVDDPSDWTSEFNAPRVAAEEFRRPHSKRMVTIKGVFSSLSCFTFYAVAPWTFANTTYNI
jgi:hypothetical protein